MRSTNSASGGCAPFASPGQGDQAGRLDVQFHGDRAQQRLARQARAFEPLLGSGARFARRAHRLERGARGAVGLGERGLGGDARVGGGLARRLGLVEPPQQFAPLLQKHRRRVGERFEFGLRGKAPLGDLGDIGLRLGPPLDPGALLGGDRAPSRLASFRFARQGLRRGLRLGEVGALLRGERARALQSERQFVARGQIFEGRLGARPAFGRLVARCPRARQRLVERGKARKRLRAAPLGRGELVARGVRGASRFARALASRAFGVRRFAQRGLRARRLRLDHFGRLPGRFRFAREIAEAVLFDQPARGRRRRLGGRDETVPAP